MKNKLPVYVCKSLIKKDSARIGMATIGEEKEKEGYRGIENYAARQTITRQRKE